MYAVAKRLSGANVLLLLSFDARRVVFCCVFLCVCVFCFLFFVCSKIRTKLFVWFHTRIDGMLSRVVFCVLLCVKCTAHATCFLWSHLNECYFCIFLHTSSDRCGIPCPPFPSTYMHTNLINIRIRMRHRSNIFIDLFRFFCAYHVL